ncbi:rCG36919 [Rattus norvegicus]|uniref:RCG36919 n=1 Tax=Rattus norvegicus TaxID=10116 RepID=A6HUK4_RAT|nr:rCG36919 [Rattus norvegicus]
MVSLTFKVEAESPRVVECLALMISVPLALFSF